MEIKQFSKLLVLAGLLSVSAIGSCGTWTVTNSGNWTPLSAYSTIPDFNAYVLGATPATTQVGHSARRPSRIGG